ncbi:hypothetical protein OROGR_019151 [Orobanche gracilis]
MSAVAGPIPNVTSSICEARKNDYQAFRDALDLIDQTNDCSLFPPEYDFTEACSCNECCTKIMELLDFEKEIKAKINLVRELGLRIQNTEERCLSLSCAAEWTKKMLDLLHKNLKSVSEKSGVSLTLKRTNSAAKLEDVDLGIVKLISDSDLIRDYGVVDDPEQETDSCDDPEQETKVSHFADSDKIADEVDTVLFIKAQQGGSYRLSCTRLRVFHYRNSKVKDKANGLLQEILEIETEHQKAKKSAELLDPFSSRKQIEKQIKLLKKLPVEELYLEVEELIAKISPIDNNRKMVRKARNFVTSIVRAMIRTRMEFWRSKGNGKEHSLNGLNHTLDSLLNKVKSFKNQWEEEYASFVTPYDRSYPKRQRTES